MPGDRRLDQVPDAVQLVTPAQVFVLLLGREDLDEAVDVAVGALRSPDEVDGQVGRARQFGVRRPTKLPTDGLEPLVHVRVEEREDRVEHHPERLVAALGPGRELEVVEVAGALELGEAVRDRPLPIDPGAIRPEPAR